jgi:Radical SAM superfamily
MGQSIPKPKRFCLVLIKPSHYDDDGYVIQWFRSPIPSNSLAVLYGLAQECARTCELGEDVTIDIHALDECNIRIKVKKIAALIEDAGSGMVMLVGVQSNQFPRAIDIARPLRERGIQVAVGGFHTSGVAAMLGGRDRDLELATSLGISVFAGEIEGRMAQLLRDAYAGRLAPVYDFMNDLPGIAGSAVPFLPAKVIRRTIGQVTTFDAGRGCPYQCSFCTIINVQGRKSRHRSADDVEKIIRTNREQGVTAFFITDDDFARNKDWEPILDRLIYLREVEGLAQTFTIQVDTMCHKIPNFIEKCARAGVRRAFIGLENIRPANLLGAKKRQNKIGEYRKMLLAWKKAGVMTYCGYIIGFPNDTIETIEHDVEVLKRELPVDALEFFNLTPLPGSEDHLNLVKQGRAMEADLNQYDLNHVTTGHALMSKLEWQRAYRLAWEKFYTYQHIETILRRGLVTKVWMPAMVHLLSWFKGSYALEDLHPLECGVLRLKYRRDRRPGLPLESVLDFYPRLVAGSLVKLLQWGAIYVRIRWTLYRLARRPDVRKYSDIALSEVSYDDDTAALQLFKAG